MDFQDDWTLNVNSSVEYTVPEMMYWKFFMITYVLPRLHFLL